nr:MAG TPA: hypothetical protein [Caudoviricetes sp.]
MSKSLMLKVYDVDYSFIIKNYLDEKLWEKEWTIFIYKKFQTILRLHSIDVKSKTIRFEVTINDNNEENKSYWAKSVHDTFIYNLSIENMNILKKKLNSTILKLIHSLEINAYIEYEEDYQKLDDLEEEEQRRLTQIAEDFLDDEGVSNSEIRDAYINYYVDKNEEVYNFKSRYRSQREYNVLADFYIVFLEASKNKEKLKEIKEHIEEDRLSEILESIREYEEYMNTDEFEEDMQGNLDSI